MKGFNFCNACNEYLDCEKFHEMADYCLKYGANLMENLNMIQSGKIVEWLEKEDKKIIQRSENSDMMLGLMNANMMEG